MWDGFQHGFTALLQRADVIVGGIAILLYLALILLSRWNIIAKAARNHLLSEIESERSFIKAQLAFAEADAKPALEEALHLLETAKPEGDKFLDKLFWSRGREIAGWREFHNARRLAATRYTPERVRTRMQRALPRLRTSTHVAAPDLVKEIEQILDTGASAAREQALMQEVLEIMYDERDKDYQSLDAWENKATWLIITGLMLIFVLLITLGKPELFLLGAIGGYLGRLTRILKTQTLPTDYGAYWATLFLSPIVGALAGWAGILLIVMMGNGYLKILGSLFDSVSWTATTSPVVLGFACLFGFSERFFEAIVTELEEKALKAKRIEAQTEKEHAEADVTQTERVAT